MRIKTASFLLLCIAFSTLVLLVGAGTISGVFSFSRGSLNISGNLFGFEPNGNGVLTANATADVVAICQNPGGREKTRQASLVLSSVPELVQADGNGEASVSTMIPDPSASTLSGKAAGCPSDAFTIIGYESVSWSNVQIQVEVNGVVEMDNHYACIDAETLTCTRTN